MAELPVITLNEAVMTPELSAILQGSQVEARFRYELLTNANVSKGFLNCVLDGGTIESNYLADIKRRCSFTVGEMGNFYLIDFLNDRIKIYYEIFSPYSNSWLSYPLGVYLMSAGVRDIDTKLVTRAVEGNDLTLILKKRKHLKRFVVPAGSDPIVVVRNLLNLANLDHNIVDNPDVINDLTVAERSYDPGSELIYTINDLLGVINYRSLYFDNNGIAVSEPYASPQDRIVELGYVTNDTSLIAPGATAELDLSDIPNIVQVVVSQPDRPVIVGLARNDNPESTTSTVNSPENLYTTSENEDVTTLSQANAKAKRILAERSQVYEAISFSTALVPLHGENTILGITHTDLGISDIYSEVEWRISLTPGALMTHRARRLVSV